MKIPYIILLVLWILAGSWYAKKTWCGTSVATKPAATKTAAVATTAKSDCDYSLMVKTDDFTVKSSDNFQFKIKSSKMLDPTDDLKSTLEKIAEYVNANPDRILKVEGHFHSTEGKAQQHENQGLARAEAIKGYLVSEYELSSDQVSLSSSKVTAACFLDKKTPLLKGASITIGDK